MPVRSHATCSPCCDDYLQFACTYFDVIRFVTDRDAWLTVKCVPDCSGTRSIDLLFGKYAIRHRDGFKCRQNAEGRRDLAKLHQILFLRQLGTYIYTSVKLKSEYTKSVLSDKQLMILQYYDLSSAAHNLVPWAIRSAQMCRDHHQLPVLWHHNM